MPNSTCRRPPTRTWSPNRGRPAEVLLRAGGCSAPDTHGPQLIALLDGITVDQLQETTPTLDRAAIEDLLDRFLATC